MANVNNSIDGSDYKTLVSIEYVRVNKIDGIEFVPVNKMDDDNDEDDEQVRVYKIDERRQPGLLYGTVIVTDCRGDDHIVYHRASASFERLVDSWPNKYISLTGPSSAIPGHDTFVISVNMWLNLFVDTNHVSKEEISKEIAKGVIVWDQSLSYEQPLKQDVLGTHGSVTVSYFVIREALNATIEAVFINESSPTAVSIYGTIKAYRFLGGSLTTRMLFDKSGPRGSDYVKLPGCIPLACPGFPVPANSHFIIEADLRDRGSDDQIVLGSVQFTPISGTQKKNITGKNGGEVQVSITFE